MLESTRLAHPGIEVTRLGMGGCPLGGAGWGAYDETQAKAAITTAFDLGVNLFDTADCYGLGQSEQRLAAALGRHKRDAIISSKFGIRWDASGKTFKDASPAYARQAVEASLKRLGLEQIPLYFLHWPDGVTPIPDIMGVLSDLRAEGKIGAIGVSNMSADQLAQAAALTEIAVVQLRFSLIHRSNAMAIREIANRHKISIWGWGALGEGLLTGKFDKRSTFGADDRRSHYPEFQGRWLEDNLALAEQVVDIARQLDRSPAQVALRWLLDTRGIGGALFGAKSPTQVHDNVSALGWNLPTDAYQLLAEWPNHENR
jgi:myo-inositol catabolism protein IolS